MGFAALANLFVVTCPLNVGVVRGVWGVWNWTGLATGLASAPPVCGSVSERRETALCAAGGST